MKGLSRGAVIFLSTGAFSGYAPVMPGTVGTLVGVGVFLLLSGCSVPVYLVFTVFFTAFAVWVSGKAERIFEKKDPSAVVIDEIAGYLIAMAALPPDWGYMAAGFFLFRVFDIVKPYPANRINDRMPGGPGIVLDDAVAGIYANLVMQVWRVLQ